MGNTFIVSEENNIIYSALLDGKNHLIEIHPEKKNAHSIVGDIYIGRVSNIIKGLKAVFVNIGLENDVFLQVEDGQHFIYTNSTPSNIFPKVGDELLIQITKDAYRQKAATATGLISITGRYCILTYKKNFVGMSSKIRGFQERTRLKEIFTPLITEDYGFIIRTNAEAVSEEDILKESEGLIEIFNRIKEMGKFRKCFQCVYKEPDYFIRLIRDLYTHNIEKYIFDNEDLYNKAFEYFEDDYHKGITQLFYLNERNNNLYHGLGLENKVEKALQEKVWLDSGANLIIQPTEALVVIDVNTSKSTGKKNFEETVFSINVEAAHEIARQLRLRNLSGIIIVDFIDMQKEEHKKELLDTLTSLFQKDRIKTTLVDMTPLGLVEITRKKTDKNIYERFKSI